MDYIAALNMNARLAKEGDAKAKGELFAMLHGVFYKIAYTIDKKGIMTDDLAQQCAIGALEALRTYEPDRNTFYAHMYQWCYGIASTYYRQNSRNMHLGFSHNAAKVYRYLAKNRLFALSKEQIKAVAAELNVSEKTAAYVNGYCQTSEISLQSPAHGDDSHTTLGDMIEDDSSPEDLIMRQDFESKVVDAVRARLRKLKLSETKKMIIQHRLLAEDNVMTLREIGEIANVSAERVRQVEQQLMEEILTTSLQKLYQQNLAIVA